MSPTPSGRITRGTTGTNRLRRVDRWIARHRSLRTAEAEPLVVDLGFGASGVTALELEARLHRVRPDVRVCGLEIDPARVARARGQLENVREGTTIFRPDARVSFARGGFEVPVSERPRIIRAFNVLRQYDEGEVPAAWERMASRLDAGGILVEGTCDELGRVSTWIEIGPDAQPRTLTIALRLTGLELPSIAAERLPKALIHRNVPGEGVYELLRALDVEWTRAAPLATFSPLQRWQAALAALVAGGWPLLQRSRWRLGELTLAWDRVAPR